ncbi:MAG: PTS IIA-like nitrogen regulatory protein PtsN [Xanthomonadales bacterium]|nr:PTS IIA-like nitrogen regulatory protein PtsN [Xanthomonadales bacterium]NNL96251.1 PTS IIA-like nitrogen regulatory protein PtsN [Xanthomonadales bacterium]
MLLSDLLSLDRVLPNVRANSKKRLLELISEELVRNDESLNSREIFESLCARERLGSTGLGNGVAIPHGRISENATVQAIFVKLSKPLAFDAQDGKPVDLLFALVVPQNCSSDHLKLLSQVAEQFSDPQLLSQIRNSDEPAELLELLSGTQH